LLGWIFFPWRLDDEEARSYRAIKALFRAHYEQEASYLRPMCHPF